MNLLLSLLLSLVMISPAAQADGGKSKPKKKTVTVEGKFSCKRGVMTKLSCYCFDAGYITTASGDEIAICFEKGEMEAAAQKSEEFGCDDITVTGVYVDKVIAPEAGEVCSPGTMRYLKVMSFNCR